MTSLSTYECPACTNNFTVPSDDVEEHDELACPTCNTKFDITDEDEAEDED